MHTVYSALIDLDFEELVFVEILALFDIAVKELMDVQLTATEGFLHLLSLCVRSTRLPAK